VSSEEAVKALFVRDEPHAADLCIVLGHNDPETSARRVRYAARLYAERFVPRVLVTGGVTAPGRLAEAELMAAVAVEAGVQPGDIILEPRARTTLENMTQAAALLRERDLLEPLSTVILVSCAYHMGRSRLLAEAAFPPGVRFLACPHDEGFTDDCWRRSAEGRTCVSTELALYHRVVGALGGRKG
jgi:uncharacterized SAM-binding protein YcdF (DUF218 family)